MNHPSCPTCGMKMKEYRHVFSQNLAEGLQRLYDYGKPVNLKHLGLTRNQWDNFQKLRYWNLVEKTTDENGKRLSGVWGITPLGKSFIEGNSSISRRVITYRGTTVGFEGALITFVEGHPVEYKTKPEYAQDSQAHIPQQEVICLSS